MPRPFIREHLLFMSGLGFKLGDNVILHLRATGWRHGLNIHGIVEQVVQRVDSRLVFFLLWMDHPKDLPGLRVSLNLDFLRSYLRFGPWAGDGERVSSWRFDILAGFGHFLLRASRCRVQPGTQTKLFIVLRDREFAVPVVGVSVLVRYLPKN